MTGRHASRISSLTTHSPSKWALVTTFAVSLFLSGLSLPTNANNPEPTRVWISPLPGERPVITGYYPQGSGNKRTRDQQHPAGHRTPSTHMGVDFAATFGEEIRAPITGVISFVGSVNKIPIVVLTHPEFRSLRRTTYMPATTDFGIGVVVLQGEKFARVAPLFHCARPCLHWGERIGTKYSNPMKHLGRAVLLPRFS